MAAKTSYPTSEVKGGGKNYLMPEVRALAERSYPTPEVRGGCCEEIPLIQGKEQRLCFTGAAVKRYPTSKIRETRVRQ